MKDTNVVINYLAAFLFRRLRRTGLATAVLAVDLRFLRRVVFLAAFLAVLRLAVFLAAFLAVLRLAVFLAAFFRVVLFAAFLREVFFAEEVAFLFLLAGMFCAP